MGRPVLEVEDPDQLIGAELGLCGTCCWGRVLSSRSSSFLRCGLTPEGGPFGRYPPLPVVTCDEHREAVSDPEG